MTAGPPADRPAQTVRVAALDAPTADVRILSLAPAPGAGFAFRAGQYVCLGFADLAPRDYSLASQPGQELLEFHIRVSGPGEVAAHLRSILKVGEAVSLEGPFGDAYLRPEHPGPTLAIAGGTGIVPINSITRAALAGGVAQEFHIYWGARAEPDLYAEAALRDLEAAHGNLRLVAVLSDGEAATPRRRGNVTDAVAEDFADLTGFNCYVAGPLPMVAEAVKLVAGRGVAEADIHADPFVTGDHHSALGRAQRS